MRSSSSRVGAMEPPVDFRGAADRSLSARGAGWQDSGVPALLATAFVVGLLGGVHCMAMCGGVVAALGMRAPVGGAAGR
ncbi:MAG TPA: sulfite exporter TauE/SafE family protein, partial [Thermoanaerobaculia bacterium]|nr:sulfite exporter TauE/SafE family protein [Thermoanaerobaculia bacterium]